MSKKQDVPEDLTVARLEVAQAPMEAGHGIDQRPCEMGDGTVDLNERWEILKADGTVVWRHQWHTEPM